MDDLTQTIKEATDIVALVGEHLALKAAGRNYKGVCPFHDDRSPSLSVSGEYQNYRCWACGAKGDVFTFLQEFERISFVEAKEKLAERAGIELKGQRGPQIDLRQQLYPVLAWAEAAFRKALRDEELGRAARDYLHARGLSAETADGFRLGFAPGGFGWLRERATKDGVDPKLLLAAGVLRKSDSGQVYDVFRNRLVFPIRDERDRVLGFGGRELPPPPGVEPDKGPKYLNTPATAVYNKSAVLYGFDVLVKELRRRSTAKAEPAADLPPLLGERVAVVMEGYTDCLMAWQHGLRTAVATCGTALTEQHVGKLRLQADRVVVLFDGDGAGQKAARDAAALFLRSEVDMRLCVLPGGADPCDFLKDRGLDELCALVAAAPDALEFHLRRIDTQYDTRSIVGRRQATEDVLGMLALVPELRREEQSTKFNLALSRVVEKLGGDEMQLRRRIAEIRQAQRRRARPPLRNGSHGPQPGGRLDGPVPVNRMNAVGGDGAGVADAPPPPPMDKLQRRVVEYLVSCPHRSGEVAPLFPLEEIAHPALRDLAEACYRLADEVAGQDCGATDAPPPFPTPAMVHRLREAVDRPALDKLIVSFVERAPQEEEEFLYGWETMKAALTENRRRARNGQTARTVAGAADDQAHLAALRAIRDRQGGPEAAG